MINATPARLTGAGVRLGVTMALPLLPGVLVFGMSFGTVAQQTGLSLVEAVLMSALVFAGASQLAALSAWQTPWTPLGAATVVLLVFVVNSRLILMGAALHPWMSHLPWHKSYPLLAVTTDSSWVTLFRAEAEHGRRDVGILAGTALCLWTVWTLSAIPGWWFGAIVTDPKRFALDLVVLVFFAAMLVPIWKGARKARPWAVAGIVALAVHLLVPGPFHVLAGTLAGALAGALFDD
jgi:4-azaleucine resistance transporter AzlC